MEKKIFKTKFLSSRGLGKNEYVKGRISGIQYALCDLGNDILMGHMVDKETGDTEMATLCTDEQYMNFMRIVEKEYPGLCVFDINNELFKAEG